MGIIHSDKKLARRMARGDQSAFDEFFDTNFARLYRFTVSRIGNDEDAVKDIVQAVLCRAVEKIDTYRGEAALYTWLCRLCRNEISDHLRRRGRILDHEFVLDDLTIRGVLESLDRGEDDDPQHLTERYQLGSLIQSILDYLPARQGNVLEWKYVHGLSVREIAERLQTTETAVQSLLARARENFRAGFNGLADADIDVVLGK